MNRIWIKLYLEILDDPKMGRLPDHLWRRTVEMFLIAGRIGNDGKLPPVGEMAWTLRTSDSEVRECLEALSEKEFGIVRAAGEDWYVANFEKYQYSESYERVKRYRNAKSNGECNDDETALSSSSSISNSYSTSREGEGAGEETRSIPETPRQAAENPRIRLYEKITDGFPGQSNYRTIIETMDYLENKHGSDLEGYLMPFWSAWSTRLTKDRRKYSPKSLVWLYEWAMQGNIPKANGHEPKSGEAQADKQAIIRKVARNAKR
jgi:hypothetical protein